VIWREDLIKAHGLTVDDMRANFTVRLPIENDDDKRRAQRHPVDFKSIMLYPIPRLWTIPPAIFHVSPKILLASL